MKTLKPIPIFQSEQDERRFWEINDAPDDGPLTAKQVLALRNDVAKRLPKGKLLARDVLFT
jgi:hypothetical protein